MPELPAVRAREVVAALEKAGFQTMRQKGSHLQMKKEALLVTIPAHRGDLDRKTLRSILRQANLSHHEFLSLLKL